MAGHNSIQILRGSQTYDPAQVDLLDGQPFYSKKNKQLYIGDNTQEELKPVGAANLKPGEGIDSVVQTYSGEVDDLHYGNTNTGESAAVFGEANNNTANRALLAGKLNENKGANSIVGGLRNKSYVNHSMVGGYDNTNEGDGQGSFVNGCHAINRGQCSFVNGYGEESAPLLNEGGAAWLGGDRCKIGSNGSHALVHGFHLISNYPEQKVFGKYNLNKSDTLLELGNGTAEDARKNVFEVTKTGVARAYGTPVDDNDLVPFGYMKQYIKDNFATLMAEYLAENAATADDIKTIFNEEA